MIQDLPSSIEWRRDYAQVPYRAALDFMTGRNAAIAEGTADELVWLLEHPPLYTAGVSARADDLLDGARFPVFESGRGGQYTYHGPGQRVAYVMLDLTRRGRDVRRFVTALENWVIGALDVFNLLADVASVLGSDFNLLDHRSGQLNSQFGTQCFT
jgi:lipoyl(octanoyl) transferase